MLIKAIVAPKTEELESNIVRVGKYKLIPTGRIRNTVSATRIIPLKDAGLKYVIDKNYPENYYIIFWSTKAKESLGVRSRYITFPIEQMTDMELIALSELESTRHSTYFDGNTIIVTVSEQLITEIRKENSHSEWLEEYLIANPGWVEALKNTKALFSTEERVIPCILE